MLIILAKISLTLNSFNSLSYNNFPKGFPKKNWHEFVFFSLLASIQVALLQKCKALIKFSIIQVKDQNH